MFGCGHAPEIGVDRGPGGAGSGGEAGARLGAPSAWHPCCDCGRGSRPWPCFQAPPPLPRWVLTSRVLSATAPLQWRPLFRISFLFLWPGTLHVFPQEPHPVPKRTCLDWARLFLRNWLNTSSSSSLSPGQKGNLKVNVILQLMYTRKCTVQIV